jgi:hypothetical protein
MDKIFKTPLIFNGEDETLVLIYGNYIIGKLTQEGVNSIIKNIEQDTFNDSGFESLIIVKDILDYKFERDFDFTIAFSVLIDGLDSYKSISFKNAEEAIKAENSFQEHFKQLGFKREERPLKALEAATTPAICTAFVAIVGGLITWFAYSFQDWKPQRDIVVKKFVYYLIKISQFIGFYPFLIITLLLMAACLRWMIKRMVNPPILIKAVKN